MTQRWREMDSNHRSPVMDQLVETVLFEFPAEARKRTIGGRDLNRAIWAAISAGTITSATTTTASAGDGGRLKTAASPDGGPKVRIHLSPAGRLLRTSGQPHQVSVFERLIRSACAIHAVGDRCLSPENYRSPDCATR